MYKACVLPLKLYPQAQLIRNNRKILREFGTRRSNLEVEALNKICINP